MVLFCCDVGVSGLELKATPWGFYKLLNFKVKMKFYTENSNVIRYISVRKINSSIMSNWFYNEWIYLVQHKPCIPILN